MSWTLLTSLDAGSSGGGTFTSATIDTTGATLLLAVVASYQDATEPTLSDSATNTWASQTAQSTTGVTPGRLRIHWVDSATPTTSASHSVTLTGAGAFAAVAFAAFSGSAANPDDQFATGSTTGTVVSPAAAITPSQNGSLVIAALTHSSATSPSVSIDSSLSIFESRNFSSGNHYGIWVAWLEQVTAASIDPSWTLGASRTVAAQVMSFLPAPGVPTGALAFTGVEPVIGRGIGVPAGAVAITGQAPDAISGAFTLPISVGAMSLTGVAPTVSARSRFNALLVMP